MSRPLLVIALSTLLAAGAAHADTLLVDRAQASNAGMPSRGMTTGQVQTSYGAPTERLEPRGGQKPQWPTINRWSYPAFTVYFEKNRVVDAVANQATAQEIGPRPATP